MTGSGDFIFTQYFVVGYDPLVKGDNIIQHGVQWIMSCEYDTTPIPSSQPSISLTSPRPPSSTITHITEPPVQWRLEVFRDSGFTIAVPNDIIIDIGANATVSPLVYIRASANNVPEDKGFVAHINNCHIESYRNFVNGSKFVLDDPYDFINNGCLEDTNFVNRTFSKSF